MYIQPYSFMFASRPFYGSMKKKSILSLGLVAKPFGGLYRRFGRSLVYSDLLECYRAAWAGELSGFFFPPSLWLVVLSYGFSYVWLDCVTPRKSLTSLEPWLSWV